MKNFHFLVILLLGFFLMPGHSFACENKSEKHSSKKEISSEIEKRNCCESNNHSKDKSDNSCGGKCKHSKCFCTASFSSLFIISDTPFKFNHYNFSTEKEKIYNSETFISSDFTFLWLIPKIG